MKRHRPGRMDRHRPGRMDRHRPGRMNRHRPGRMNGPRAAGIAGLALTAGILAYGGFVALVAPGPLAADGGTLRVANVPMGAYRVNVYTAPTPIRPDSIDVSLLVTFERGRGVALGLDILIVARRVDGAGEPLRQPATREAADDPRFYAAKFALGSEGEWEMTVRVEGPEGEGEVTFQVSVQEAGPLSNPWVILLLAFLPLVLVGWWLKSSGGGARANRPDRTSPA